MTRRKQAEAGAAEKIREALENPEPAPQLAQPGDPGPELGDGSQYERPPFPPGCPVKPLGVSSDLGGSQKCFYLNWNGQLAVLEAGNRHGKNNLIHLFGPSSDWLEANFPQWSKPVREQDAGGKWVVTVPSVVVGFDQAKASRALIEECVRRGIFDPAGKMRGVGAHRQRGGGLVLHCGDKLLASEHTIGGDLKGWHWTDPGVHEGYVYTAAPPIPRPHHESAHPRCAETLLKTLNTWAFKRGLLDARFVLGGIGASLLGGALPWRPNIWITGGRGTGKSTLNGENGLLDELLGTAQFRTSNTSAAAVRSSLKNSTVPVFFDESEASEDNRRVNEVIETARVASSGGKMHRGSQDQTTHEFTLRSAFWFSSINIPPLKPQDRSRFAIVELQPLPKGTPPIDLGKLKLPALGAQLLRRMIDGWERLEATKLKFHTALQLAGHDARACDQFGTLLACADVLLYDRDEGDHLPDDEEVAEWAAKCRPDRLAEIADEVPDHVECLQHILTSQVQARGGEEREALETWIERAIAAALTPLFDGPVPGTPDKSPERLQQMGIKLVNARWHPPERDVKTGEELAGGRWGACEYSASEPGFLAIAYKHQALARLFEGQKWQGGVWRQSLARFPDALEGVKTKFGKMSLTAVLVPLFTFLDDEELPDASRRKAAEAWVAQQKEGEA